MVSVLVTLTQQVCDNGKWMRCYHPIIIMFSSPLLAIHSIGCTQNTNVPIFASLEMIIIDR